MFHDGGLFLLARKGTKKKDSKTTLDFDSLKFIDTPDGDKVFALLIWADTAQQFIDESGWHNEVEPCSAQSQAPLTHSCMCHQLSRKLSLTYHQWTQSPQAI